MPTDRILKLGWVEISTGLVNGWQRVRDMPPAVRARRLGRTLKLVAIAGGSAIAALHADGAHVPLWLDVAEAIVAGLASGQHLPTPAARD